MIFILFLVIATISLLLVVFLVGSKISSLRVIDVQSIPQQRTRDLKEKIILEKLRREGRTKVRMIVRLCSVLTKNLSRIGRRVVQRLYAIEQKYQKLSRVAHEGQHAFTQETMKKMLDEAGTFVRDEEFIPAEKIYIDIISHNPKSVDAYEDLGNLYMKKQEYDQARETFQFTLRLSPQDASVHVSLAELESKLGNQKVALDYLRKAIVKRPKNTKYLDFYIETSLQSGSLKDTRNGLNLLRKVNPENQKIADFEQRFDDLKETYISKTSRNDDTPSQTES